MTDILGIGNWIQYLDTLRWASNEEKQGGCMGPILNTRVHHRWGAHQGWLPGSLIKLKISIRTSDLSTAVFWVNPRIHIGEVWGGDGQWEARDSEISICWRLGGASATVQTLQWRHWSVYWDQVQIGDYCLVLFVPRAAIKRSPVTLASYWESAGECGIWCGEERWQSGGGNLWRSLGPIVPALGWANTGSGVKTAEIIPDAISLIAEDGQSGRALRGPVPNQLIISEGF